MSIGLKAPPPVEPQSDLMRLKGRRATTLEGEKARLRKVTREFEAFFTYFMLKTMRKTVPENSLDEGSPFANSMGKDVFTQMFDMEISRTLADGEGKSLGSLLYQSLEKTIEAGFERPTDARPEIKPLEREGEGAPVRLRPEPLNLPRKAPEADKLPLPKKKPLPLKEVFEGPAGKVMERYGSLVDEAAAATKLDSALIASVIATESAGNPKAVSQAGAKGLMQLIDSTAKDMGVEDVFDPRENILAGARYLGNLIERFGDLKLGLAAYNAGPGNVNKYGGIPPFKETQNYVRKVTNLHTEAKGGEDGQSSKVE